MNKVIIPNPDQLSSLKTRISQDSCHNLHVLADFDKTLTFGSVNGIRTPSLISLLRSGQFLIADYASQAQALYDQYHPLEINPNLSLSVKKKKMQDWWRLHLKLLVKSGLKQSDLAAAVDSDLVQMRHGVPEFLEHLYQQNIPLVILSAGLAEMIKCVFLKFNLNYSNIYLVANHLAWDADGRSISPQGPIIHSLNKDDTLLIEYPSVFKAIDNRRNVILLGDSLDDLGMITGFEYDNLIKIGFLCQDNQELLAEYERQFDVIVTDDHDFSYITDLISELK